MNLLTNKSLNVIITPEIVFELKTILWLKSLESYIEFIIYDVNVKSIKDKSLYCVFKENRTRIYRKSIRSVWGRSASLNAFFISLWERII